MSMDQDIEDYLAYFEAVYEGLGIQDNQKTVKLVGKLPHVMSKYAQGLLRTKVTFDIVK